MLFDQADRLPGGGVGAAGIKQWADGGDGEVAHSAYHHNTASQTSFPDPEMCFGAFALKSCFVQMSSVIRAEVASTADEEFWSVQLQTCALRFRLIIILWIKTPWPLCLVSVLHPEEVNPENDAVTKLNEPKYLWRGYVIMWSSRQVSSIIYEEEERNGIEMKLVLSVKCIAWKWSS